MNHNRSLSVYLEFFRRPSNQRLLIFLLGLLLYLKTIDGEFVSDDLPTIVDHEFVLSQARGVWAAFNSRIVGGLSFVLNYQLGKFNVAGYHLFNIIVHVINAWLVQFFVRLTFQTPRMRNHPLQKKADAIALTSALLFLLHPIQTSVAAYIVQRFTSLATGFYLMTFIFYIQARLLTIAGPKAGKRPTKIFLYYILAICAMGLGLFTKEITYTLPLAIVLYEVLFMTEQKVPDRKRIVITFLIGMGLVALSLAQSWFRVSGELSDGKPALESFNWPYFLTELNVLRIYLFKLFFPWPLSHSYDYPLAQSLFAPHTIFSILLFFLLLWLSIKLIPKEPVVSFCILWYFITTSVETGFVCFFGKGGADVMYDHWLYLPMAGFAFLLGYLVFRINFPSKARILLIVLTLCVYSALTYQRNEVWRSEIALWQDTVEKFPERPMHQMRLGLAYHNKGQNDIALSHYQKAFILYDKELTEKRSRPLDFRYLAETNIYAGLIYFQKQDFEKALECYRKAENMLPGNLLVDEQLGVVLYSMRRYDEAIEYFLASIKVGGGTTAQYDYLSKSFAAIGKKDLAEKYFNLAEASGRYSDGLAK